MRVDKQSEVLKYLKGVNYASIKQIYDHVPFGYYNNWKKHLGALLGRMVKTNLIERESRGFYKYKSAVKHQSIEQQDPNQITLFK